MISCNLTRRSTQTKCPARYAPCRVGEAILGGVGKDVLEPRVGIEAEHIFAGTSLGNCFHAMRRCSFILALYFARSAFFFTTQLFLLLFRPEALVSGLTWSRHSRWNMVTRTIFPLLLLKHRIIHVNIVEHSGEILVSEQLL